MFLGTWLWAQPVWASLGFYFSWMQQSGAEFGNWAAHKSLVLHFYQDNTVDSVRTCWINKLKMVIWLDFSVSHMTINSCILHCMQCNSTMFAACVWNVVKQHLQSKENLKLRKTLQGLMGSWSEQRLLRQCVETFLVRVTPCLVWTQSLPVKHFLP